MSSALLITDSPSIYEQHPQHGKVLIGNWMILRTDLLQEEVLAEFNLSLNGIEMEAAERMLSDLHSDIKTLASEPARIKVNRYRQVRSYPDQLYGLLYDSYKKYALKKHFLLLLTERLLEIINLKGTKIHFKLGDEFRLIQSAGKGTSNFSFTIRREEETRSKFKAVIRNLYYAVSDLLVRTPKKKEQKRILLFISDTPIDYHLFSTFFKLIQQQDEIHLTIINFESGNKENLIDFKFLESEQITVLPFRTFKCAVPGHDQTLYSQLEKIDPSYSLFRDLEVISGNELYYHWIGNAIQKLQPDLCIYNKLLEAGRGIAEASEHYGIPSVNVEYGLFSDDPLHMECNIRFSVRACLGESSIGIWKKHHDPTPEHFVTGFCKMDAAHDLKLDKKSFFESHGLDATKKTILFGSSWGGENKMYNYEKRLIIAELSESCKSNGWNLIIKKHPSEFDTIAQDVITNNRFANQVVFNDQDCHLYEVIQYADLVTTQASSIIIDAMYFDKPFSFLTKSKGAPVSSYFPFSGEAFVKTYSDIRMFDSYAKSIFDGPLGDEMKKMIASRKEYYLFKCDGNSSQRLLNMIKERI